MYNLKVHWKHSCEVGRIFKHLCVYRFKAASNFDFQMSKKCWSLFLKEGGLNGWIKVFLLKIISQKITNAVELYHIGLWFFSVLVGLQRCIKSNVLRIKKYNFSVYYQQNFAFRYIPNNSNFVHTMFSLHSWWIKSALQRYKNLSKNNFCITDKKKTIFSVPLML